MRATVGLGRHPDNDIVLNDRTLSRFHARLERRGADYVVIDLGAQNGVFLNGQRITGERSLNAGDRIGLGCYVAIFDAHAQQARRRGDGAATPPPPQGVVPPAQPAALPTGALTPLGQQGPTATATSARPSIDDSAAGDLVDIDLDVDFSDDFSVDAPDDPTSDFDPNRTAIEDNPNLPEPDPEPAKEPTLVLLYNGMEVSRHPVPEGEMVIGRSKTCDVVISLLGLSRRHTKVSRVGKEVTIADLGSQNGTWVNNHRIDNGRTLRHGDLLNYYEYGVLFLEDPDVDIGVPGADFPLDDDTGVLDGAETNQHPLSVGDAALDAHNLPHRAARTAMSPVPIADSDVQASAQGDADADDDYDLFEGFELSDSHDYLDGVEAAAPDDDDPLAGLDLDDDDDDEDYGPTKTELLQQQLDLDSSLLDDDGDVGSFSTGDPTKAVHTADLTAGPADIDKTNMVDLPVGGGRGRWPSDDELMPALSNAAQSFSWQLAVFLDNKPYTQMVVSQQAVRVGTDARCELALPKKAGLAGWQMTVVDFGGALLCMRASPDARVEIDDVAIDQAVLQAGDVVVMGRVRIEIRHRG